MLRKHACLDIDAFDVCFVSEAVYLIVPRTGCPPRADWSSQASHPRGGPAAERGLQVADSDHGPREEDLGHVGEM